VRLCETCGEAQGALVHFRHSRYGDPLRNLPAWELQMIEDGKSSAEIDAEFDRRYNGGR